MAEKKVIGEIHLPSGERVPVFGEDGRYWVAENSRFQKLRWTLHPAKKEEKPKNGDKKAKSKKG